MTSGTDFGVDVSVGRLTGQQWGEPGRPLILLLPGFSQDERSYDEIGPALAPGHHVVALALRGRGRSVVTPPGTWGPASHARDVIEVASALGAERFAVVGWSFGALVSLRVAELAGDRLERVALIDAAGTPDPTSLGPIMAGFERLAKVFATVEEYVESQLASGALAGHEAWFRPYLAGDLVETEGGFRTRTTTAILEDAVPVDDSTPYDFWPHLTMPTLLVRAGQPVLPGLGYIVTEADRDRFAAEIPAAQVVEIDANHHVIGVHPDTAAALVAFFRGD